MVAHSSVFYESSPADGTSTVTANQAPKHDAIAQVKPGIYHSTQKSAVAGNNQKGDQQRHDDASASIDRDDTLRTIEPIDIGPSNYQRNEEVIALREHFRTGNDIESCFHDAANGSGGRDSPVKATNMAAATTPIASSPVARVSYDSHSDVRVVSPVDESRRRVPPPPLSRLQTSKRPWTVGESAQLQNLIVTRNGDPTVDPKFWHYAAVRDFNNVRSPEECYAEYRQLLKAHLESPTIPPIRYPPPSEDVKKAYRALTTLPASTPCEEYEHTSLREMPFQHPWSSEEDLVLVDNFRHLTKQWVTVRMVLIHRNEESIKMRVRQMTLASQEVKRQRRKMEVERERQLELERQRKQEEEERYIKEPVGSFQDDEIKVTSPDKKETALDSEKKETAEDSLSKNLQEETDGSELELEAIIDEHDDYLQRAEDIEREFFSDDKWMEW